MYKVVIHMKDGRTLVDDRPFETEAEASTYSGILGFDDFEEQIDHTDVAEVVTEN